MRKDPLSGCGRQGHTFKPVGRNSDNAPHRLPLPDLVQILVVIAEERVPQPVEGRVSNSKAAVTADGIGAEVTPSVAPANSFQCFSPPYGLQVLSERVTNLDFGFKIRTAQSSFAIDRDVHHVPQQAAWDAPPHIDIL